MLDQYDIDAARKRYAEIVAEMKLLRDEANRCAAIFTRFALPYSRKCRECPTIVYSLQPFPNGVACYCQSCVEKFYGR